MYRHRPHFCDWLMPEVTLTPLAGRRAAGAAVLMPPLLPGSGHRWNGSWVGAASKGS
jgi:hypothetical protein